VEQVRLRLLKRESREEVYNILVDPVFRASSRKSLAVFNTEYGGYTSSFQLHPGAARETTIHDPFTGMSLGGSGRTALPLGQYLLEIEVCLEGGVTIKVRDVPMRAAAN
jgi:hypothetical protein